MIDSHITIQLLDVQGGRVRFGVEAPPEVSIRREELPPRTLRIVSGEWYSIKEGRALSRTAT